MASVPLIIDCDPGVDDAIALLLAFASPELNILGITTVAGNVPLELTQVNARKICELANKSDMAVYAGCPRPMLQPLQTAEKIHGQTGLDGTDLPEPTLPLQSEHGVAYLIRTLEHTQEPIILATLGPLTNVAIALIQAPHIAHNIQEIVMMGGAITHGNVTPSAEFNIYGDPHAASVVFDSGVPITMLSLDVTHQVITTPERLTAIRAIGTPVAHAAAGLLSFYGQIDSQRYQLPGAPLHDPNVIAYLLQPTLYEGNPCHVVVDTMSSHSLGRTIVDIWNASEQPPNASVIQGVNSEGFYQLLLERLQQL